MGIIHKFIAAKNLVNSIVSNLFLKKVQKNKKSTCHVDQGILY